VETFAKPLGLLDHLFYGVPLGGVCRAKKAAIAKLMGAVIAKILIK
jgi:hypothetical protein